MTTTYLRVAIVLAAVLVLSEAAQSGEAHWPETLTIGTGSPGGKNTKRERYSSRQRKRRLLSRRKRWLVMRVSGFSVADDAMRPAL